MLLLCLNAVVHLAFAVAVWSDAFRMLHSRRPELVGPFLWFLATLLGGPWSAGLYWILHHSTISPDVYRRAKAMLATGAEEQPRRPEEK